MSRDLPGALAAEQAEREMQRFVSADGSVTFAAPAHIVSSTRA